MKHYKRTAKGLFIAVTIIAAAACNKAENYYEKLYAQPEVNLYASVYGVSDTLTLQGRLNPANNLEIHVGGVKAEIVSVESYPNSNTPDHVGVLITEEMGIGKDRPITITSGGNTIQCPSIQIVEGIDQGYLSAAVQLVHQADFSSGNIPLFCRDGKGTVYYWNPDQRFARISKDGNTTTVLEATALADEHGSFSVVSFQAGGVDPMERYLWFSALTADDNADNSGNQVYRLCRYDIQVKVLTTLNRSLYPTVAAQRTLNVFTPFEGQINQAKLFAVSGIYPASNGNVFLHIPSSSTVARLDASGELTYLFRLGRYVPDIYNPATGTTYSTDAIRLMLPGVTISTATSTSIRSISPDDNLLYARIGIYAANITQIDLANSTELYSFTPTYVAYDENSLNISGSFDILSGNFNNDYTTSLFGYLPLPDAKVLLFYYQNIDNARYPALATLNFKEQAGRRYAPGKVIVNRYTMDSTTDQMLNYDEEGMIYMTADNKTAIVKTKNQ